jgi:hypothetical protein
MFSRVNCRYLIIFIDAYEGSDGLFYGIQHDCFLLAQ